MAKAKDDTTPTDADERLEAAEAQAAEREADDQTAPEPDENLAYDKAEAEYFDAEEGVNTEAGERYYVVAKPKAAFAERTPGNADPDLQGGDLVDHGHGDKVIVVAFDDQSEAEAFSLQTGVMGTLYDREDHALERARFLGEGEN